MHHRRITMLVLAVALIAVGAVSGCRDDRSAKRQREFFPDMDNQPSLKAQSNAVFFLETPDEVENRTGPAFVQDRTARLPVPGTVPFGRAIHLTQFRGVDFALRNELLRDDEQWAQGRRPVLNAQNDFAIDDNGVLRYDWVERMPVAVTRDLIELGQQQYDIYCLPCHGGTGQGDGLVGVRWAYPPTKLTEPRLQPGGETGQDGWLFHVIRNGVANPGGEWELKMPAYAGKLTIEETWAIVAYVRALQLRVNATPDMLDQQQRLDLNRRRSANSGSDNLGSTAQREDAP